MALPIITIHRGYASYLVKTLLQAKATNPQSKIVLLGDPSNKYISFVDHENITNYFQEAEFFAQIYRDKHINFNSYNYELLCFQRWFILKEFMQKNDLKFCFHIDSDVLLYINLAQEFEKFSPFEMTLSLKGSAHNAFMSYQGLERFCQHLIDFYSNPELFEILQSIRQEQLQRMQEQNLPKAQVGGICDMTLFRQYYDRNSEKIGSTSKIVDGSVYDSNINTSKGFEMKNGIKNITWIDRKPYGKYLETGQLIRFNSLHFQGSAKKLIDEFFTGNRFQSSYYSGKGYFRHVILPKLQQQFSRISGQPI
jgi:hypothetical protein